MDNMHTGRPSISGLWSSVRVSYGRERERRREKEREGERERERERERRRERTFR